MEACLFEGGLLEAGVLQLGLLQASFIEAAQIQTPLELNSKTFAVTIIEDLSVLLTRKGG
jgi:hypothetical protein